VANPLRPTSKPSEFGCDDERQRISAGVYFGRMTDMAKKPGTNPKNEFVLFNVIYEDGSQRSNRRVPAELLGGIEQDEPARGFIITQDREIAQKSGRAPLPIKNIRRAESNK
jgi:hypothetical protein